jgi:hypothetical protein
VHVAELVFTIMLAAIASKVVAAVAADDRAIKREMRSDEVIE